jgi:hypothetical protein
MNGVEIFSIAKSPEVILIDNTPPTLRRKREYMKKYIKEYRKKNPEKLYKKIQCVECGGRYMPSSKTRHFKNKKHAVLDMIKINEKKVNEQDEIIESLRKQINEKK